MIDSTALLRDLKSQLKLLQADLRGRAENADTDWGSRLRQEYDDALRRERTGHSWLDWRDNEVDQAAVAWLVATTFLRFCEDNDLLAGARLHGDPTPVGWIAGPGDRTQRSEENLTAYFREHPTHNRRHWLQQGFRVLAEQPAGEALVDPDHNPVWTAEISAETANGLISFWRTTDASGQLVHDFSDPELDTRFLGDLYQDLSEHAKKTYALLQTPVFVEEFILDQTLTPALDEFGVDGLKLIDPTCGSGHFLLGAFERLSRRWQEEAPALDAKQRVRRAMDSIHGVDLNPFAVAIARFRLTVAGLKAAGERSLVGVPSPGFHLAIGDALLGEQGGVPETLNVEGEDDEGTYFYDTEDLAEYDNILRPGQYHVVVGNPPYITVKDKVLNQLYRQAYKTTKGKYALSVPFLELFFRLAIRGEQGRSAGHVGQITANSFTKREFGSKVIEDLLAGHHLGNPVDLTQVIDTSGAYIPGHSTPTVILVGRRRRPVGDKVRAVLGIRGEQGQPENPAQGSVWNEIVEHLRQPGFVGTHVSVTDLDREVLSAHPWSLSGGGAAGLKLAVEQAAVRRLSQAIADAGFSDITGNDEVFLLPERVATGRGFIEQCLPFVEGDVVRDFSFAPRSVAYLPTTSTGVRLEPLPTALSHLWRYRALLTSAVYFGKTPEERGLRWYDHAIFQPGKHSNKKLLTFAFVSTHNHFVFERGGHLFNKTAPVIKLPEDASEEQHLGLLGILNSSTACFWLHSMCLGKPLQGEEWQRRYEYDGSKVSQFPLPEQLPVQRPRVLDSLARELGFTSPHSVIADWLSTRGSVELAGLLKQSEQDWARLRQRMVFEQEELDWEVYRLYGLIDEDLTYSGPDKLGQQEAPNQRGAFDRLVLGERAFEIALAREVAAGTEETAWFERHRSTPITAFPENWPEDYAALVQRRLDLMAADRSIRLLEKPEYKRRWQQKLSWADQLQDALESAILDRLELPELWQDAQGPVARSVAELADRLRSDTVLRELAQQLTSNAEPDLVAVLSALVADQAVPYLAAYRYKPEGLEKYRAWQQVWALQRREDAGEKVTIPVPPKYKQADFRKTSYWRARGKLDVPKERFIAYPGLARNGESTPVLGWAGWTHRDQALALAREIATQQALGAEDAQMVPIVAGLVELEPWLQQWHREIEPAFGTSAAAAIGGVIDQQLARLAMTREQVTAWEPPAPTRGRRARTS